MNKNIGSISKLLAKINRTRHVRRIHLFTASERFVQSNKCEFILFLIRFLGGFENFDGTIIPSELAVCRIAVFS